MRIGVYGAGAIGGYLGVRLAAAGHELTLLGRPWLADLGELSATDLAAEPVRASPRVVFQASELFESELILVTVKGGDSEAAGRALAGFEGPVISLQNGLHNPARIAAGLGHEVIPGLVAFNVVMEGASFRKATSMDVFVQQCAPGNSLAQALRQAGEGARTVPDMAAVQAGKLLLNLGNGVCAATGLSIQQMTRTRASRRVLAACIDEGVRAFRAAGQPVSRVGPLPASALVHLLPLPDWFVHRVARTLISIDERAMSSTLQDLHRNKRTEIDDLNGEIVALAPEHSPVNRRVVQAVKRLETRGAAPLAFVQPETLLAPSSGLGS